MGISEIDKYAIAAHESLHGKVKNYGDVSKLEVAELPNMDLFTYSFPCQDISNAGKQRGLEKGSETRSSLLWECERIIQGKLPKFLMMENVKNLVGKKNKPHFEEWLQTLETLGYNNYWKVINAKYCGVPQNRERVFCVSIRKDVDYGLFSFEADFDNGIRLKDILEDEVDEKYYLSKEVQDRFTPNKNKVPNGDNQLNILANVSPNNHGGGNVYDVNGLGRTLLARDYKDPIKILIEGNVSPGGFKSMDILGIDDISKTLVANGGGNTEPKILVKEATKRGYKEAYPGDSINLEQPNSKTRRGRVGHQIANTLTTSCNQAVLSAEYRIRKLTPRECFRLQGVSDEDIKKIQSTIVNGKLISNRQQYKLAGNSIVVKCMKFLKNL